MNGVRPSATVKAGGDLWARIEAQGALSVGRGEEVPRDPRDGVSALGSRLRGLGLEAGSRLGTLLPNGPELVTAFLAALSQGVTLVPLSPALPVEEQDERLRRVGAEARLLPGGELVRRTPAARATEPGEAPAIILFTSGSEGTGRAVALSADALLHVASSHHAVLGYPAGTEILGYLPWTHAFGFTLELLMGLLFGARLRTVEPERFAAELSPRPGSVLFSVPRMLERLEDSVLGALEDGIIGGAPIRGALRERLARTRLRVGYGQTECAPGVSLGERGEWPHDDFLGRALGCELQLRPHGEDAQLFVRGPGLALGYLEAEGRVPVVEADGWRATGDLAAGVGGNDGQGGYVFRGRVDELFKLDNGRMVNPVPYEQRLEGHVLLLPAGGAVLPLVRGELPAKFQLALPHLPPRVMPESFWTACTTPTGKISRRRALRLLGSP